MPTEASDPTGDPLVLIADRDEDSRRLYADFLQFHRWRVIGATGGPEALALAISRRPDVVVSEIRLPGFDGMTLSELLRRDGNTAHIPIVFVTSDATVDNLARAAASGADAVLTKPCLPENLFEAIVAAVDRSRELRVRAEAAGQEARTQAGRAGETADRNPRRRRARVPADNNDLQPTLLPPTPPAAMRCPLCGRLLTYLRSHVGGVVSHREQWDYFECPGRCGTFEYRVRTRKIKRVANEAV